MSSSKNKTKGESVLKKKIKTKINNQKQYKIFHSRQLIGIIMILIFAFLFVVSIIQVSGFSTLNSYTVGMLFGYYSYFIYVGFIILGLCYLFQIDIKIEKFIASKFKRKFYFAWLPYLFFSIGVALVTESIIQLCRNNTIFPGAGAFKNFFTDWWNSFTDNSSGKGPILPNVNNSGIIISLFMSSIVSWSGYIISIIVGALLIAHYIFYIFFGSLIKIFKKKINNPDKREKISKEDFEEYKTKILDLSFEDSAGLVAKPDLDMLSNVEAKTTTISIDNPEIMFPIDSPIVKNDIKDLDNDFVNNKTNQINLERNITTEFKLNNTENSFHSTTNIETFNFELDIFESDDEQTSK